MSERNKAIVKRFIEEVVNKGNPAAVDELFTANYVLHSPGKAPVVGPDVIKQMAHVFRIAFPDWHDTIEEMIAEGNKVVTRWTERGTHRGQFEGIAPTGRRVTLTGIDILRVVNGKIVEAWVQLDMLGMMEQLGAMPAQESLGR